MAGLQAKHNQASAIVADMSRAEKVEFCSGRNFWHLHGSERHKLPSVMVTDGPHGLRKQNRSADHVGLNASVPATCFPTACALASSWDVELLRHVGHAIGQECVAEQVTVLLGPGMNIKRHPYCGRNFEYFSEDPLLTGKLAAAFVQGVQANGVGTSIKHYAVNNQEHGRMFVDAIVDERSLRELYLRGFEIAVKEAQPWTVMCAYNRVNGTYCSDHDYLLNQILRDEWGFEGLVVTDWGATNDRVAGVRAGLDLEMPASGGVNNARVLTALQDGSLRDAELDTVVIRNVSLSLLGADLAERQVDVDMDTHHQLARHAAAQCAVLLQNRDGLLPLQPQQRVAVIGEFATRPRYQGAGSSQVNPTRLDKALDFFREIDAEIGYARGYDAKQCEADAEAIAEAAELAKQCEVAVVFAGLPGIFESEGFDRDHMHLPEQQNKLIDAVCEVNNNVVVVLCNGAPVYLPWADKVASILEAYLPGQAGGAAIVDLLYGRANPSGKLAETFPLDVADLPASRWFPGEHRQVQYREGLFVGYRYFCTANKPVQFAFGHGLSYTSFTYSDLQMSAATFTNGGEITASVTLENTGPVAGAEVVQLYVHHAFAGYERPTLELKSFAKVYLKPGQRIGLNFVLNNDSFAIYDPGHQDWQVPAGDYVIQVGASSVDIRLQAELTVASDDRLSDALNGPVGDPSQVDNAELFAKRLGKAIPLPESIRPFHLNSSVADLQTSWLGRRLRRRIVDKFSQDMGGGGQDATLNKMFEEMANNMPLRGMVLFSRGQTDFASLEVMLALLNHQYFKALRLSLARQRTK